MGYSPEIKLDGAAYERNKLAALERQRRLATAGQDIGDIPPIADPGRRRETELSFRLFCETYFSRLFSLAWSRDHLRIIERIERAVLSGGMFAMAMPRGSGKTTLCQAAALWAILAGHQRFVMLVSATAEYASAALANLKAHLSGNDLLLEDFPESIYPIRRLEGESRRCSGQRYDGRQTQIGWSADEIILPTIAGSRASGALVRTAGLTGNIRGSMHVRPDGESVRPTFVVVDDPQTDASARSPAQVNERYSIVSGAILGLAGPGKRIAAVMPCTVIRTDDLADRILNRSRHPEWQGERTKLIYNLPTNETLWQEYGRIRADSLRAGGDGKEATDYYKANRDAMDVGALVAWPERYDAETELSAIQHAMNLRIRDERAFRAEYQNDPVDDLSSDVGVAVPAKVIEKHTGDCRRGEIPIDAEHVVGFIDVQGSLLYWSVVAWRRDFTGAVVDYGAYPDQRRGYFTLRDAKRTLATVYKDAKQEAQLVAGLRDLTADLFARSWKRADGLEMPLERVIIDAGWGPSTDLVYRFCQQSEHRAHLLPSHGRFVGASSTPFAEYSRKAGDRVGFHWRLPSISGKRQIRHVLIDTNYWKTFIHQRLAVPIGDAGSLALYDGGDHQLIAEHLCAEYPIEVSSRGRTVYEWKLKPSRPDNHWLDCLVGCAVAGSIAGCILPELGRARARGPRGSGPRPATTAGAPGDAPAARPADSSTAIQTPAAVPAERTQGARPAARRRSSVSYL